MAKSGFGPGFPPRPIFHIFLVLSLVPSKVCPNLHFGDPKTLQIGAKTRKNRCPKITCFVYRFVTVFRGAWTPEFVLPSRRNANFRKIDVFRKSTKKHHFWDPQINTFPMFFGIFGIKISMPFLIDCS